MQLSTNERNEIIYTMRVEMVEFDDYGQDTYILDVAVNVECRYQPTVGVASKRKHSSVKVESLRHTISIADIRTFFFQILHNYSTYAKCGHKEVRPI